MPPHHDPHDESNHDKPPETLPPGPGHPEEGPQKPGTKRDRTEGPSEESTNDGYLFVVAYNDDAERKRAEYIFNTWEDGEIRKPEGLVRIAEDGDHTDLYQDLLVKFRSDQVDAYALSSLDAPETPDTRTIERSISAEPAMVRSLLQYLISRKKGTETSDGEYEVYTNKGRADIALSIESADTKTTVTVHISGHPPVLDYLESYFQTELDEFTASR